MPKFIYKGFYIHLYKQHRCTTKCEMKFHKAPEKYADAFYEKMVGFSWYKVLHIDYKKSKEVVKKVIDDIINNQEQQQ